MKAVFWNNHYFNIDFRKFFDPTEWMITNDIDTYINYPCDYKLSMIGATYILHSGVDPDISGLLDQLLSVSNKVIVFDSELHSHYLDPIFKYRDDKIIWVIPGIVHGIDNTIFNNQWFRAEIELYRNPQIKEELDLLHPFDSKPMYFDALLGAGKPHKEFVAEQIRADQLEDKIILRHGYKNFIYPDGVKEQVAVYELTEYKGISTSLIPVVPIDIYNESAYSIVGETSYDNRWVFLTEKTAKCFMGRRLFIMFAGQHYLKAIRDLGFRTFDGVIDESYDGIEDNQTRWNMAYDQVKYLCSQPQQPILDQIKSIVDYNYELMWSTDWRGILDQQVLEQIDL
jgi:hypothetical protein